MKTTVGTRQGRAPGPLFLLDFAIAGKGQFVTHAYHTRIHLAPGRIDLGTGRAPGNTSWKNGTTIRPRTEQMSG